MVGAEPCDPFAVVEPLANFGIMAGRLGYRRYRRSSPDAVRRQILHPSETRIQLITAFSPPKGTSGGSRADVEVSTNSLTPQVCLRSAVYNKSRRANPVRRPAIKGAPAASPFSCILMNDITSQTAAQAIGDHAFHRNLHQAQLRSGLPAFLLWFFLGSFGAHLMYLRRWAMLIFHYLMAILTVVAVVLVFRNNSIHDLGVGLAALWMAFIPIGIYNFGSLCILFPQVNYCNEDSALRLAGHKTASTRVPERIVILLAGGALAVFIGAMSRSPDPLYRTSSTTPDTSAVQQPTQETTGSVPAANAEQASAQSQAMAAEAASQAATEAAPVQAQEQQPPAQEQQAPAQVPVTPSPAAQQTEPPTDLNTNPNQVYATSFDCGQSHSQNEYLICHTPALASADVNLASAVMAAKTAVGPAELDALKARMRGQWNFREKHCNDVACLNSWYTYQLNSMSLIVQTRDAGARLDATQN